MTAWLGVASAEHVKRGVSLGIAQIDHGKARPRADMQEGDTIVYYSPVERVGDRVALRCFTAIGIVADGDIRESKREASRSFVVESSTKTRVPWRSTT